MYIAILAICVQCKNHCHRVETQLQSINIASYRVTVLRDLRFGLIQPLKSADD